VARIFFLIFVAKYYFVSLAEIPKFEEIKEKQKEEKLNFFYNLS